MWIIDHMDYRSQFFLWFKIKESRESKQRNSGNVMCLTA